MKILVVDDEELLVKGIRFNLQNEGYEVITGTNGAEALEQAKTGKPDLIILDVMMPEMDGFTACARIREFSNVPIILLTAKADDMDKLMGFDYGADDYLTKPFNILELKARIRALLRRANSAERSDCANTLTIGRISLDLDARNAYRNGTLADLTAKEFDVIEFLMRNPNRVYSREALLDTIWAYEYRSDIRTVDVHIRRLREKLEENPAEPKHIMTKWGVGYYFRK
jgi:DNA-binding response OmpR family regulator